MKRQLAGLTLIAGILLAASTRAQANIAYHGGRIMPTVRIIPIFYGWPLRNFALVSAYTQELAGYINGARNPSGKQTVLAQYGVTGGVWDSVAEINDTNPRVLQVSEMLDIIHLAQSQLNKDYANDRLFLLIPGPGYSVNVPPSCGFRSSEGDGRYFAVVPSDCPSFNELLSREVIDTAISPNVAGPGWDEAIDICPGDTVNFGHGNISLPWDNLAGGCPSSAFDTKASSLVNVIATTSQGNLFHTLKRASQTWVSWGDVKGAVGSNPGSFGDVDAQSTDGIFLHVVGVVGGKLFHTLRTDAGWIPFFDVSTQLNATTTVFTRVGLANVNNELHACAATSSGGVLHAIRFQNGGWIPFDDVLAATGSPGIVTDVDCAGNGSEMHIAMVTSAGAVVHGIRRADGSWTGLSNVETAAGEIGTVRKVTLAVVSGELHLTAVNRDNQGWWTVRHSDGSWQGFGIPPSSPSASDAANANVQNSLNLVEVSSGVVYHRILNPPNSWTAARNLNTLTGNTPGMVNFVGETNAVGGF